MIVVLSLQYHIFHQRGVRKIVYHNRNFCRIKCACELMKTKYGIFMYKLLPWKTIRLVISILVFLENLLFLMKVISVQFLIFLRNVGIKWVTYSDSTTYHYVNDGLKMTQYGGQRKKLPCTSNPIATLPLSTNRVEQTPN